MSNFEIMKAPSSGAHLIDASAGTGKTYTISGMVVRMIVDYQWPIESILVVTFTEAAASDLKGRIREMLIKVVDAFSKNESEDEFIACLVDATADHQYALRLLNIALQNFDEAPIFTIHGFCQRVLQDNFLECGLLLDSNLETDQWRLLREITEDFFRANLYNSSPLYVSYSLKRLLPEKLRRYLGVYYSRDDMRIVPEIEREGLQRDAENAEKDFVGKFTAVTSFWPQSKADVERIFQRTEGLNRTKYSLRRIPLWIAAFDAMVTSPEPDISLFESFHKFTSETIESSVKNGFTAPTHELFIRCGDLLRARDLLVDLFEQRILLQKQDLYSYVRDELDTRKEEGGYYTFDDMPKGLASALKGRNGLKLSQAVTAKYKGALIDEFQDTDPLQYEIFKTIFSGRDSLLLFIGDPKQAIYSFRGADIFAYMQAVGEVDSCYTLGHNWRSVPGLITATNTFFSNRSLPFLFKDIEFKKAKPAKKENDFIAVDGIIEEPFHLAVLERGGDDDPHKLLGKEVAKKRILSWMSCEIKRLILLGQQSRAVIGKRDVCAGDIAVLVRTNREARQVQKALAESGVASVLYSSESLFASREAEELLIILRAMADPSDSRALRGALATRIVGLNVQDLDILGDGQSPISSWIEKFKGYHDVWMDRGFGSMFSRFLAREKVRPQLLRVSGGERSVTNLLHLFELLHLASVEKRLGVAGLCKHLDELITEKGYEVPDEHQLRLESEAELVQIVTIHKSKGLQYPIVFCPFSWDGIKVPKIKSGKLPASSNGLLYHDREKGNELILDIGSIDISSARDMAFQEELAENLRILYVALTRAVQRCYFFWGPIYEAGTSAAAYLLHCKESETLDGFSPEKADILPTLNDAMIHEDVMRLVSMSGGNIALTAKESVSALPIAVSEDDPDGECPEFSGKIDRGWRVSSFSSIAHDLHGHIGQAASSAGQGEADGGDLFSDIRNFPRGPGPGVFLHSLLEGLDFTAADSASGREWVRKCLAREGYDPEWQRSIDGMLFHVLNTPLSSVYQDVRLADVEKKNRLDELEFYFPLKDLEITKLGGMLSDDFGVKINAQSLPAEGTARIRGFMKGYVDLLFHANGRYYIIDWKSNHLGYEDDDYLLPVLEEVMGREMYTLQYLIYTVALNRYLAHRMPGYDYEEHFGGVFYLFLRGMKKDSGSRAGVYYARPDKEMVLKAADLLTDRRA